MSVIRLVSISKLTLLGRYHPHLVQTLTKWSSKIQAVAPSVLLPSNRNAFSNDRQHLKNAVQLVNDHLTAHDKLLGRTQQWRGKGQRLGVEAREEPDIDTEVYDDTDFYQQLLRDVIDARGGSGTDDWMVIQKQKKAKKKVDTKASKGRKLRFIFNTSFFPSKTDCLLQV